MRNKREKASPCGESREAASHTVCESPVTEWGMGASGRLKGSLSKRGSACLVLVRKDCFCWEFWQVVFVGDCGVSRAQKRAHLRRVGLGGLLCGEGNACPEQGESRGQEG